MKITVFEKGFNYSQDGPGNRLIYHLSGCNMFCPWCSNPEGMTKSGIEYETDEIIREIRSSVPMFFDGGGVTFTGGECTLQSKAICEIIDALPEVDFCIESNADTFDFLCVAQKCNTVIVDFKSPDKDKLLSVTGGNIITIENNIRQIEKSKYIHIRIPLIHNFNDDELSLDRFIDFFSSLNGNFDVELLPYHEYGKEKWLKLLKEYTVKDGFVKKETIKKFVNKFNENSIKVIKT